MKQLYVFDIEGAQVAVLEHNVNDLIHDEMLDQSETLTFNIPTGNMAEVMVPDGEIETEGRRFIIRSLRRHRSGPKTKIFVKCEALWYKLLLFKKIGSFELSQVSVRDGLEAILEGTDWVVDGEGTTPSSGSYSMEEQDKSVLELLRIWASTTGRKMVFNTQRKMVTLQDARGSLRGETFRYGRNIDEVEKETYPPDITVIYPYGADALSIAGVNGGLEYLEDFSYYTDLGMTLPEARERFTKMEVVYNDSILVDTELLEWAETQMAGLGQGDIYYKMKVKDLTEFTGFAEDRYRAGDRVAVYDEVIGIDLIADVVRIKRHPNNPRLNQVELAKLAPVLSSTAQASRPSSSRSWDLFAHKNPGQYQLRNDGTYSVNRIPLRFREGGEAFFGFGLQFTGVDAGTLHISIEDIENAAQVWPVIHVPYTNGQEVNVAHTFFFKDLLGSKDYRVRMHTVASGGASGSKGINIAAESSHFWIHAHGAVQETPTAPNMIRFDYTGADQFWTIPDGVTELHYKVAAAAGGGQFDLNGKGSIVYASLAVVPGTEYLIEVGGQAGGVGTGIRIGKYPDGGDGGLNLSATAGYGGGGRSSVRVNGTAFSAALIVAGGGGGENASAASCIGGDGGFYTGENAFTAQTAASGATQFAAGAGNGTAAFGQGGNCEQAAGGFHFPGGGGGGGWYGGGANDSSSPGNPGGPAGAGGSGWIAPGAGFYDLSFEDGANGGAFPAGDGYVELSWEDPL